MKNPKSVFFLVIIYLAFVGYISYSVYKGAVKITHKIEEIKKNGHFKIPTP